MFFYGYPNAIAPYPMGFHLNPVSGDLDFQLNSIQNPILVLKTAEWRKINGTYVYLGSIKREVYFWSYTPAPNKQPELEVNQVKGGNWLYVAFPQTQNCLTIRGIDNDSFYPKTDTTTITPVNLLPGSSFWSANAMRVAAV